jgi:hypothetical protein
MDKNRIDFIALRRLSPGRFSEDVLAKLSKGVQVDDFKIDIHKIELGEDASTEQLNVVFFVRVPEDKARRAAKTHARGSKLYFSFTSAASVEENLEEFEEFVRQHAITASTAPQGPVSIAVGRAGHSIVGG